MFVWHALVLAAVEGITEFLPISSTGHLIMATRVMEIAQTDFVKSFEITIQLGAICSVAVLYVKRLIKNSNLIFKVLAAFVPTAAVGFALYGLIKKYLLGNLWVTVISLFAGGIAILCFESWMKRGKKFGAADISSLSWQKAVIIGLAQSVSVVPGVSRSLATIFGGMTMGLSREAATEFSFLLAIPTMAAATGLDLMKSGWNFTNQEWLIMGCGFVGSFVSAGLCVKWLLSYVREHDFKIFGYYRIVSAMLFWRLFL